MTYIPTNHYLECNTKTYSFPIIFKKCSLLWYLVTIIYSLFAYIVWVSWLSLWKTILNALCRVYSLIVILKYTFVLYIYLLWLLFLLPLMKLSYICEGHMYPQLSKSNFFKDSEPLFNIRQWTKKHHNLQIYHL